MTIDSILSDSSMFLFYFYLHAMKKPTFLPILILLFAIACTPPTQENSAEDAEDVIKVQLVTTKGDITLKLYNETPKHRDNFKQIVQDGVLDSLLFHRVIESFMIQGGDVNSKDAEAGAPLGDGDLPYEVPAEITPNLFHKKGVLAAARGGHPDRVSSSTQFYIVQGKVFTDSLLNAAETRINGWLADYYIKHDSAYKDQLDSLYQALEVEDWETYGRLNGRFWELSKTYTAFEPYKIPEAHREVYKTIGGTPHLDQNYTVFGEVISGLAVVDSIAAVEKGDRNRPIEDVRILNAKIIED